MLEVQRTVLLEVKNMEIVSGLQMVMSGCNHKADELMPVWLARSQAAIELMVDGSWWDQVKAEVDVNEVANILVDVLLERGLGSLPCRVLVVDKPFVKVNWHMLELAGYSTADAGYMIKLAAEEALSRVGLSFDHPLPAPVVGELIAADEE